MDEMAAARIAQGMERQRPNAPWRTASDAQVAAFATMVAGLEARFATRVNVRDYWGLDAGQAETKIVALIKRANRRAGYKAIVAKYGEDIAKRIIAR